MKTQEALQYPRTGRCMRCGNNRRLLPVVNLCPPCHKRDLRELELFGALVTPSSGG